MIFKESRETERKRRSIRHLPFNYYAYKALVIRFKLALKRKWAIHRDVTKVFSFVIYKHNI